jgi:hypothetical protein
MVLKSAFVAAVCTGVLAISGPAVADQYRPAEFLNLEFPKAVFSSKRIGPEARFAPVRIEARSDEVKSDEAQSGLSDADLEASIWPKLPPRKARVAKTSIKPDVEKTRAEPQRAAAHGNARVKLAKRHGNPLDAQATDTRVQTWPCRSGGICNWHR